ncbi:MAG: 16S rRNA (cytosine(1402)-N(4))-methyltransferase RsmH [Planctomycetes bacterium]|nr:16S rRNA (cytosine(1402)-N(4))-methyltransferase RsmH [Planctomycetota bacterium]
MGETRHVPVLAEEVLHFLAPSRGGRYLDLTFGGGGHARKVLELGPRCQLVGVDRDQGTLAEAVRGLAEFAERLSTVHARFDLADVAAAASGIESFDGTFDGVLLDLGFSSQQLEDPERGLSFERDAALDMRMDRSVGETAAELLGRVSEQELADLLFRFGDERRARAIARALVERRRHAPVRRTLELADLVERVLGGRRGSRTHPATRTFQALRMAVNDEIGCLERVLEKAPRWLAADGRLVVIAFHSGEDRVVKRSLRAAASSGEIELLTRKVVDPGPPEIAANPRSRSAKLRAARRRSE